MNTDRYERQNEHARTRAYTHAPTSERHSELFPSHAMHMAYVSRGRQNCK